MHLQRYFVSLEAMNVEIAFDSINELIVRKSPVKETLQAITSQVMKNEEHALARIWLIDKGDICKTCIRRPECIDQTTCLHLTASRGRNLQGKLDWTDTDRSFSRFPIGVRKIGHVAESGESVHLNNLLTKRSSWIANENWVESEKIDGLAAHPLKFHDDTLGVIAVFSRKNISEERFEWLRTYAEQASIAIANARAFEQIEKLRQKLENENDYLKEEIKEVRPHKFLIGQSLVWDTIRQQIDLIGASDATVLITGESGTGKEVVARSFHEASPRSGKSLVKVNCAAISSELFESEFFGHIKGAFTGAVKNRLGRFQLADGGTIFLDEIGEIPLPLQGKLLRVLQEKQFERVGEDITISVDVRVIAATNKNLEKEVEKGNFRQDLFYRLSVFPLHIPPLRERLEDIEPLIYHFLEQFGVKTDSSGFELKDADIEMMQGYLYPGNVRELRNIVERAVMLRQSGQLNFATPNLTNLNSGEHGQDSNVENMSKETILTFKALKELERESIMQTLKKTGYKVYGKDGAAVILGAKPTTLISKIKSMQIPMRPGD